LQTLACGDRDRSIMAAATIDSDSHTRSVVVTTWSGASLRFEEAFNQEFDCRTLERETIFWTAFHLLRVNSDGEPEIVLQTTEPIVRIYRLPEAWLLVCEVSVLLTTASGSAEAGLFDVVTASAFDPPMLRLELFDDQSIEFRIHTDPPKLELIALNRKSYLRDSKPS
jgi:hypothetical protein